jgi:tetratricopeptide (TPR) repeat protein
MNESTARRAAYVLYATAGIFILFRFFGHYFPQNWSFTHWQHLPIWYGPAWIMGFVALVFFFSQRGLIEKLSSDRKYLIVGGVALAAIFWFFRFDSFLYGGGNLRVAQLSQADIIMVRWYEYGSLLLAKGLYFVIQAIGLESNNAGMAAWRTISYLSAVASGVACYHIVRMLVREHRKRFFLFCVLFFGPSSLLLFGFIGLEPLIVAVIHWYIYMLLRLADSWDTRRLALLWLVAVLGVFIHISLALVIPSAIFVTLGGSRKGVANLLAGIGGALVTFAVLLAALYYFAGGSLEFTTRILFFSGKLPLTNYGIFSVDHLVDIGQLIFLAAPVFVLVLYLRITAQFDDKARLLVFASGILAAGGFVALLIQDPKNSMPLDYPRMTAYLAGGAFCLALLLSRTRFADIYSTKCLPFAAAFALALPFAALPSYFSIEKSEPYVLDFVEANNYWFRLTCYNYRDAYFGRKDLGQSQIDRANAWEGWLPGRSPEYLTYAGCVNLVMRRESTDEAQRQLHNLIAKDPYWIEPRLVLSTLMMNLKQYDRAKAQIDTSLILEPYNPVVTMKLYGFYRDAGNLPAAWAAVEKAREMFPKNKEIATDEMILAYRSGDNAGALSRAESLITQFPGLPFPYLIRAMAADHNGRLESALKDYKSFLEKQRNQPETLFVQQRIDAIKTANSPEK